jgi:hypothetical protein
VYRVLIYVVYGYAICNLTNHLSRNHTSSKRERSEVVRQYRSLLLYDVKHILLLPLLEQPYKDVVGRGSKQYLLGRLLTIT